RAVLEEDAPPLVDVVPGVDPRFSDLVVRCLRRDPAARFESGAQLRDALEFLAAPDPLSAPGRGRRALALVSGAALLLLLLGALLVPLWGRGPRGPRWTTVDMETWTRLPLRHVLATAPGDAWAVGDFGTIL